ncbi:MAG: hypothetical protein ACOX0A_02490 [Thermoguttaceae bacterium]|jgi:F0F1-type ATP synthase assembly protein I
MAKQTMDESDVDVEIPRADDVMQAIDSVEEEEELSPFVVGCAWVARITAYSAEFAVLVWFGHWLDKTYGWSPWGILSGAMIGAVAFAAGLLATAKRLESEDAREKLRQLKKGK